MTLDQVLEKYGDTADFLGIDLVDPNQVGIGENAPIHMAAFAGDLADVDALVAAGADVNLIGDLGNTALHEAARRGHIEIAKRLLEFGANPKIINELGQTPRDQAEMAGNRQMAALLERVSH